MSQAKMMVYMALNVILTTLYISISTGNAQFLSLLLLRDKQEQAGQRLIKAIEELDLALNSESKLFRRSGNEGHTSQRLSPVRPVYPSSAAQGRMSGERSREDLMSNFETSSVTCMPEDGLCCRVVGRSKVLDSACMSKPRHNLYDERWQISSGVEKLLDRLNSRHSQLSRDQKMGVLGAQLNQSN